MSNTEQTQIIEGWIVAVPKGSHCEDKSDYPTVERTTGRRITGVVEFVVGDMFRFAHKGGNRWYRCDDATVIVAEDHILETETVQVGQKGWGNAWGRGAGVYMTYGHCACGAEFVDGSDNKAAVIRSEWRDHIRDVMTDGWDR